MPGFRVGKPRLRVALAVDLAWAAGLHAVTWDTVVFDDVGGLSAGNSYTTDRDGLWLSCAHVNASGGTTSQALIIGPRVNGVLVDASRTSAGAGFASTTLSTMLELAQGDVVDLGVQRHTTQATTLSGGYCGWSLVRLGPKRWT